MHLDGIDHACKVHPSSAFVDRNQSLIGSVVFWCVVSAANICFWYYEDKWSQRDGRQHGCASVTSISAPLSQVLSALVNAMRRSSGNNQLPAASASVLSAVTLINKSVWLALVTDRSLVRTTLTSLIILVVAWRHQNSRGIVRLISSKCIWYALH